MYDGPRLPILAVKESTYENEYMTDKLTSHAIQFMNKQSNATPFFLYLGYNAVHNPWQAEKKYYDRLSNIKDEYMRVQASLIACADENIGILLNYLENRKLIDNTIIVFVSDNGPAKGGPELKTWEGYDPSFEYVFGQMKTLRGHKVDLYEGGIRTPMIIAYKPLLREGKVFRDMISTLDFYPTICEMTGSEIPEGTTLDGVSLVRYLREETKQHRDSDGPPDWKDIPASCLHTVYPVECNRYGSLGSNDFLVCLLAFVIDILQSGSLCKDCPRQCRVCLLCKSVCTFQQKNRKGSHYRYS